MYCLLWLFCCLCFINPFSYSGNLSKALQNSDMSVFEYETLASLSIKTLEKMRNYDA